MNRGRPIGQSMRTGNGSPSGRADRSVPPVSRKGFDRSGLFTSRGGERDDARSFRSFTFSEDAHGQVEQQL